MAPAEVTDPTVHRPTGQLPEGTAGVRGARSGPRRVSTELPPANLLRGAGFGVVAAALVGGGWFLASVGTESQLIYLTVALGIGVGYAVSVGARRGGMLEAFVAAGIAAASGVVWFYFVSRSNLIRHGYIRLAGDDPQIPLRPSWSLVRDVLRASVKSNLSAYLYLVATIAAAAYFGARTVDTSRRTHRH